ncbi:hypothetical protein F5X98DRAFT_381735 [Xylaria grammica]|nr:hypothetical protein F5X98DRAFT_381735 [Xylaria grammica]
MQAVSVALTIQSTIKVQGEEEVGSSSDESSSEKDREEKIPLAPSTTGNKFETSTSAASKAVQPTMIPAPSRPVRVLTSGRPSPPPPSPALKMAAIPMPDVKGYKPIAPKPCDGTMDVEGFLAQARIYLEFYQASLRTEDRKVLAISRLLTGNYWFQPLLQEHLEKDIGNASEEAKRVFKKYSWFEAEVRSMLGIQTKHRTLRSKLLNRLKPQVKDELCKVEQRAAFNKYVDMAILID